MRRLLILVGPGVRGNRLRFLVNLPAACAVPPNAHCHQVGRLKSAFWCSAPIAAAISVRKRAKFEILAGSPAACQLYLGSSLSVPDRRSLLCLDSFPYWRSV